MAAVTSAVVGIASAGYSAVSGFRNAAAQKKAAKEADAAAAKAMSEAKARAEVDYFAGLSVPLDAYEAEFENQLAVSQQNVEALQEGDARNLAAGVGRVGAQAAQQAEQTRIAMGEEISDLNMQKAQSNDAINQQLIEMDVAAAREQNQRKRDAEMLRSQYIQQGVQGVGNLVTSIGSLAPLYSQSRADRRAAKVAEQYGIDDPKQIAELGERDFSRKDMREMKRNPDSFWDKLTPDQAYRFGIADYQFSE